MSAPFRELFVELPASVFAILQGIGEQAVRTASKPSPVAPEARRVRSLIDALRYDIRSVVSAVCDRYGWTGIAEANRKAAEPVTVVVAKLGCGHYQAYDLDERAFMTCRGPVEEIEQLDRVVDSTIRGCCCMVRP